MVEVVALESLPDETHARVFDQGTLKTVRLQLDAGESVARHRHPDSAVVFHVLAGRVELSLDDEVVELSAGELTQFDGEMEISPRAIDPSTALVVIAPRNE